jgi:hypothetical protein
MFEFTSRYYSIPLAELETPEGKRIVYLRRRFVPSPERFALLEEHLVSDGDRLDLIAHQHLGDPEQFWRICDANSAMRPEELIEETGRRLHITLPEGIAVNPYA